MCQFIQYLRTGLYRSFKYLHVSFLKYGSMFYQIDIKEQFHPRCLHIIQKMAVRSLRASEISFDVIAKIMFIHHIHYFFHVLPSQGRNKFKSLTCKVPSICKCAISYMTWEGGCNYTFCTCDEFGTLQMKQKIHFLADFRIFYAIFCAQSLII